VNATLHLPPELLEQIAQRAAELLADQVAPVRDYLTSGEAADYMRCSKQRVYDLTSASRLPVCKDGSRSLYRRCDLDAYLAGGAA
jgi:excisionase family DNA binding protein